MYNGTPSTMTTSAATPTMVRAIRRLTAQTDSREHAVEQMPAHAHERAADTVLVRARRLAARLQLAGRRELLERLGWRFDVVASPFDEDAAVEPVPRPSCMPSET